MRLIALTCFAAVALGCSPAAAGCYGYKFVIGRQFIPGSDPEKGFEARYDLRGETFEVIEGAKRRAGTIENYCDTATVVIYESKRPDGSTPSEGQKPQGNIPTKPDTLTLASPTEDDGICWLKVSVADVSGWCFRRNSGAVGMQGKIY
jgi:hypothetical protein